MGEASHSPALVGKHFIMNYYTILHDEPQSLYKFYKEDSVYSFGIEGEPLTPESTVTGQQNIDEKIGSLAFKKCKVHLSVVDAQPTLGGGVLLMVKGAMTNDGVSRKFVQTFLLAQQPSGYYVRNDILRYLADGAEVKAPSSEAAPVKGSPEKPKEVPPAEKPKQPESEQPASSQSVPATPVPEAAQQETKPQVEPVAPSPAPMTPVPVGQELPKEAPAPATVPTPVAAVTPVTATQPKEATVPAPAKPSPAGKAARSQTGRGKGKEDKGRGTATPAATDNGAATAPTEASSATASKAETPAVVDNSWAALAARNKDAPVTPLPPQARVAPKPVKKAEEPAATPAATEAAPQVGEPTEEKPVSDPRSIYISNLPFAAKRNQVYEAFKGFGKITQITMQYEKGYAFIEYETPENAQSAIKSASETPISMDSRVLRVEERKTKRTGSIGRKAPGVGRTGERGPRAPRPDGKDRATGSPRANGTDRKDRNKGERRGTGSPATGRPAGGAPPKRNPTGAGAPRHGEHYSGYWRGGAPRHEVRATADSADEKTTMTNKKQEEHSK